mgnify:CR=1 FL=1
MASAQSSGSREARRSRMRCAPTPPALHRVVVTCSPEWPRSMCAGARQSEDRLSATRVERERLYASAWPSLGGSGDAEGTHRRPVGVRRTRVVPHLLRNWPPSTSSTCTCALCSTLMMHGRRTVWAHLLGVHRAHHRVRGRIHGPSGVSGRGATPRDLGSRQCAHASARSPRCVR